MYAVTVSEVVEGDRARMWEIWADVDRYPEWDPREERAALSGPFAVGSTITSKQKGNPGGTSTITEVEPGRSWTATSPLPGGELVIRHSLEDAAPGSVRVTKVYEVTGPLVLGFRMIWGPRIRRDVPASIAALGARAATESTMDRPVG